MTFDASVGADDVNGGHGSKIHCKEGEADCKFGLGHLVVALS